MLQKRNNLVYNVFVMLQKIGFQPGINKQISETTAEGQWVDCDNVR